MVRCSPKRCVLLCSGLCISTMLLVVLYTRAVSTQKSILRFVVEQEITQLLNKNLDPQTNAEKEEETLGFTNNGFNQYRSDRIPLDREIPDTRDPRHVHFMFLLFFPVRSSLPLPLLPSFLPPHLSPILPSTLSLFLPPTFSPPHLSFPFTDVWSVPIHQECHPPLW